MDLDEARRRVAAARVACLATIGPTGRADLVPVTFALPEPDVLVTAVDHKPKRTTALRRLANVADRPDVTLLVDRYDDEDWAALWWVRLRGVARVVPPGGAEHRTAVAALAGKYAQYRRRPPAGPAVVVRVTEWLAWP